MKEYKQEFFMMGCEICGKEKDRWGNKLIEESRFVTCADDPNKAVCTSCGCSARLTDKELKTQLNNKVKMEVQNNGKVI